MVNVIEYKFPPDRDELELTLDRVFKFVINKEKKIEIEKLVFFDLDTGQDEISNHFQEKLFKGKIDAYHILLTLDNPPLDNDHPKYARIKLFLDYLDKNQLGWKIPYFDCIKNLSVLLKNGKLKKVVNRSYRDAKKMFYDAVKVTFRSNNETQTEEIIKQLKHKDIDSDNPPKIFFQSNQGNEMGSDLDHHKMLRNHAQALQKFFPKHSKNSETSKQTDENHPLDIAYRNCFVTLCRDMGANIVEDVFNWANETRGSYRQFKVLIIDDNYKPFKNQIKVIGSKTKLKFFRLKNEKSWETLYNSLKKYNEAKIEDTANHFVLLARKNELKGKDVEKLCADGEKKRFVKLINEINKTQIIPPMARVSKLCNRKELSLKEFDFFLVDLQFGKQKIGDRMVRYLKRVLEDHGKRSPILILSLSDDSMDIQRCLNEGARGYIYKERIFSIPYRLKELYEEKTSSPSAAHSQNFRSLYQLPRPIIDRLKREQITGNKIDHEWIEHEWIDCLPKADLHVHIGGSMPADLIADLAFNHLLNMVYQKAEPAEGQSLDADEIDKALREMKVEAVLKRINEYIQLPEEQLHSVDESIVEEIKRILQQINENQKEKTMPFPNRKICDVAGNTSPLKKFLDSEELGLGDLTWDHKLCIFLVWLAYKDGYDPSHRWRKEGGFYYDLIQEVVRRHNLTKENIYHCSDKKKMKIKKLFDDYLKNKYDGTIINKIRKIFDITRNGRCDNSVYDQYHRDDQKGCCRLIGKILDAGNKDSSLIGYLRGCEISGAQLLRSFENIIIAAFRIGFEASLNRIRYMELRCSPDGFVLPHTRKEIENSSLKFFISKKLDELIFNVKEPKSDKKEYSVKSGRYYQVLDALLWGLGNEFQYSSIQMAFKLLSQGIEEKKKKEMKKDFVAPKIAILISAKRHKDLGKIKDQTQMYQMYKKHFSERTEYAPILGFDLAGAEKGFPPSVFSDVMTPLFEECTNMTIHAGEETDWLYIWQSIYKLHAARIGHGLTLGNDLNLLQLAKERKICIEMCPRGNTLTNKYSTEDFHSNKTNYEQLLATTRNDIRLHGRLRKEGYEGIKKILFPEKRSKKPPPYPLRFYYDFGLPVAICTDNPCVSNASMTEEYMEACRRSGGFSKWDILRIIKMGFKNAFLPKEEVARMLQRVGNEIYDKVLELQEIERPY